MTSLLEQLAINAINWDIGRHSALGTQEPQVKCQAFPHDGLRGLMRPAPASPPVTDNHLGAAAKGAPGCAGRPENFLVDTGVTYSVLISYSGDFSSQTSTILGATRKATTERFTQALLCCWDGQIFSHQFLVVPECPTPLTGRDILSKLGTTLVMGSFSAPRALQLLVTTEEPITSSPIERDQRLWEDKINPQVWDQGIPGRAHQAEPVIIVLRDPTRFPNQKQYPLKREIREGLQPLINKFLACGLLVPTSSPCNTPILSVKKKDGTWRMVQDLRIINEDVVPLHPTVPNPYVILGEIPPSAKWFTVLDLKNAFFFAYHWLKNPYIFLPLSGRPQEKNTNR